MNEHLRPTLRYMPRERGDFFDRRKIEFPFWTLRRALFTSIGAGFGGGILAILWFW